MTVHEGAPCVDFSELNPQQSEAVLHTGSPLVVLAGPGTGKTRVIVSRIARLVEDGEDPESILGLTFGVKAAKQMQDKLIELLGPRVGSRVRLSTFHSWGRNFLSRFGDSIGLRRKPRLMDSAQQKQLLTELIVTSGVFAEMRSMGVERAVQEVGKFIESSVHAGREASEAVAFAQTLADRDLSELDDDDRAAAMVHALRFRDCAHVYGLYEQACAERCVISMHDLIMGPVRVLRSDELIAQITRSENRHVVIDEFQDVNLGQIELLRLLCPPEQPGDLCVVGDDDQAIYAFRGSDERAFGRFADIWKGHRIVELVTNYRSTRTIVDVATAFIMRSESRLKADKQLHAKDDASGGAGAAVRCVVCPEKEDFGIVIASLVRGAMASDAELAFRNFAVIGPTHRSLGTVDRELEVASVPTVLGRAPSSRDDEAVQDLFAWMRLVDDGSGSSDVLRLLRRPMFGVDISELTQWSKAWRRECSAARKDGREEIALHEWIAANHSSDDRVSKFIRTVQQLREKSLDRTASETAIAIVHLCHLIESEALTTRERAKRIRRVARVLRFIAEIERSAPGEKMTLGAFLAHYDRLDDRDKDFGGDPEQRVDGGDDDDESVNAVRLLTAHASKGLEFKHVFVIDVRPRGFPGVRTREQPLVPLPDAYRRTDEEDQEAEQRRLFYVAMTRAETHLTLLAKYKKGKTGNDYFIEITEKIERLNLLNQEASEILDDDGDALRGDAVDLAASGEGDLSPGQARSMRRMRALREKLLRVSFLAESAEDEQASGELAQEAAELVRALARAASHRDQPHEEDTGPLFGPLKAPLDLTYTKIEDYKRCPRCFYAKHVLGIPDQPSAGMRLGSIAHLALELYFEQVRSHDAGEDEREIGESRLLEIARKLYEDGLRREGGGGMSGAGVPNDDEWDKISAQLRNVLRKMHDPDANIVEVECEIKQIPLVIDGQTHTLTAKIDRIDQYEAGGGGGAAQAFRIIDYKTGKRTKKLTEPKGDDLQLGLYLLALMWHYEMDEAPAGVAEYWVLEAGERGVLPFESLNMDKIMKDITKRVQGMLAGDWNKGSKCRGMCEVIEW